jgi:Ca-activated chloride channel family protein
VFRRRSVFSRTSDLPLTIGLIVDASVSQHSFYKKHRHDVETFLKEVLAPKDEAFLICFGNHVRFVSDLTPSTSAIMGAFEQFDRGDRSFPNWARWSAAWKARRCLRVTERFAKLLCARTAPG